MKRLDFWIIQKNMKNQIKNEVKNRGIDCLLHFTKIENLDSILKKGLIPRAILEAQSTDVKYNDSYRQDRCKNANCLSISHPNDKLFYRLQCKNFKQKWVIISIKPKILWKKDCAFCHTNAATSNVASTSIQKRKELQAFKNMFETAEDEPDRADLNLHDRYPTNPQAEILVFDVIEPKYIVRIITPTKKIKDDLKSRYLKFKFLHKQKYYKQRSDYKHWKIPEYPKLF